MCTHEFTRTLTHTHTHSTQAIRTAADFVLPPGSAVSPRTRTLSAAPTAPPEGALNQRYFSQPTSGTDAPATAATGLTGVCVCVLMCVSNESVASNAGMLKVCASTQTLTHTHTLTQTHTDPQLAPTLPGYTTPLTTADAKDAELPTPGSVSTGACVCICVD